MISAQLARSYAKLKQGPEADSRGAGGGTGRRKQQQDSARDGRCLLLWVKKIRPCSATAVRLISQKRIVYKHVWHWRACLPQGQVG